MLVVPDKHFRGDITDDNWLEIYERRLNGCRDPLDIPTGNSFKRVRQEVPFTIKQLYKLGYRSSDPDMVRARGKGNYKHLDDPDSFSFTDRERFEKYRDVVGGYKPMELGILGTPVSSYTACSSEKTVKPVKQKNSFFGLFKKKKSYGGKK